AEAPRADYHARSTQRFPAARRLPHCVRLDCALLVGSKPLRTLSRPRAVDRNRNCGKPLPRVAGGTPPVAGIALRCRLDADVDGEAASGHHGAARFVWLVVLGSGGPGPAA